MGSLTRRHFMAGGAVAGAALAAGCKGRGPSDWDFLSDDQAMTLTVLCDQIIPADDFASASEAGVVTYIDRQLMRHYRRHRAAYEAGLQEADRVSKGRCGAALAEAPAKMQLEIATAVEKQQAEFFELLRKHTMEGYYGSPRHGGNRDAVSWRMLGLAEPPVRGRAHYDLTGGKEDAAS